MPALSTSASLFWNQRSTKQKILLVVSGAAILTLGLCALYSGLPSDALDVSLDTNLYGFPGESVHITSRVNQITIDNVAFNRGECDLDTTWSPLPINLSFAESTDERPDAWNCNVIEVTISTNLGARDYEFNSQ